MAQTIIKTSALAEQQQQQIKDLQKHYLTGKGLYFKIDPNVLLPTPGSNAQHFLLSETQTLTGYMVTNYYNQHELEVTIIASNPSVFQSFIQLALREAVTSSLTTVVLAVDSHDTETLANATVANFVYSFAEYRLIIKNQAVPQPSLPSLRLRQAQLEDLPLLKKLDFQGFGESYPIKTHELSLFKLALVNNQIVGKVRLEATKDSLGIFAFVVAREERHKGYGQEILAQVIAEAQSVGRTLIYLEVDAQNPGAMKLYQRCGFEQEARFDYFTYKI